MVPDWHRTKEQCGGMALMSKAWALLSFAQARLGDDKLAARWNWTGQKRWAMAQQGREGLGEAVEMRRKAEQWKRAAGQSKERLRICYEVKRDGNALK